MTKPTVAQNSPIAADVKGGESYAWCACGLSKSQPWCDGSHSATDLTPMMYEANRDRNLFFCACKQTAKPPFCDGSHNSL